MTHLIPNATPPFAAPARIREPIDTSLDALEAEPAKIWDFAHASAPPPSMSSRKRLPDSAPPPGLRLRDPQQRLPDRIRVCPSAEERSDVSTRAQCRGQGATPPPMVCGAELGDDHVDLITFS